MLAARLYGAKKLVVEEIEKPVAPDKWVVVKTAAVAVCGTDKAFYLGTYPLFKVPLVPGHEVSGVVVEGPKDLIGKLVVPEINFSCGRCSFCRSGLYTHCPHKKTLGIDFDGGFAEYFVAPVEALHIVDGLDPVVATQVEPLAAVINSFTQFPPKPGAKVAVIGTGNIAYLATQLLRHMGLEPVVICRRGSRKASLFRGLAEVVYEDEVMDYVKKFTDEGMGFDIVFEASGDPNALNTAIEIAKPRAVIHLKSTPGSPANIYTTKAVVKELRVVGTRCGTFKEFEYAIKLLREGVVKPAITSVVKGLRNASEAFEKSLRREEMKVVLVV